MKRCSTTGKKTPRDVELSAKDWGRNRNALVLVFGGWSLVGRGSGRPAAAVPPCVVTKQCPIAATSCSVSSAGRSFLPPYCLLWGSSADSRRATRDLRPGPRGLTDHAVGQAMEICGSRNATFRIRGPPGYTGWMKGPGKRIEAVVVSMPTRLSFGALNGSRGRSGWDSGRVW
jgi:hypothetical protein